MTIIAVTTGAAAQHGATEAVRAVVGGELWGVCHGDLAVGDGIPHGGLEAPPVDEEGEAMAAAEEEVNRRSPAGCSGREKRSGGMQ